MVVKKGATKQSRINTITEYDSSADIKLQPSRLEYCHDQYIKTTGKNKDLYQIAAKWIQFFPCYSNVVR